jgi:hypothetical protein
MFRIGRRLRSVGGWILKAMEGPQYTVWMWMGFMPYRYFVEGDNR